MIVFHFFSGAKEVGDATAEAKGDADKGKVHIPARDMTVGFTVTGDGSVCVLVDEWEKRAADKDPP